MAHLIWAAGSLQRVLMQLGHERAEAAKGGCNCVELHLNNHNNKSMITQARGLSKSGLQSNTPLEGWNWNWNWNGTQIWVSQLHFARVTSVQIEDTIATALRLGKPSQIWPACDHALSWLAHSILSCLGFRSCIFFATNFRSTPEVASPVCKTRSS